MLFWRTRCRGDCCYLTADALPLTRRTRRRLLAGDAPARAVGDSDGRMSLDNGVRRRLLTTPARAGFLTRVCRVANHHLPRIKAMTDVALI